MPKMYDKRTALKVIFTAVRKLIEDFEAKGITQGSAGRGELRSLLNPRRRGKKRRGKDILTTAIQKFSSGEVIATPEWELIIEDPDKPLIHLKILRKNKTTARR